MVASERESDEHVSAVAMDLLDELRWTLSECLLVLKFLPTEADVNFSDLHQHLQSAQLNAKEAYQVSSLIHQGAALTERWGVGLSRPSAIFARHNAAVRHGASQVRAITSISDGFERHVWQLPALDRNQDFSGTRPRCSGLVRKTRQPCASVAIYLGSATFAAHCYAHATPAEREQYRRHHEAVEAEQRVAHQRLHDRQQSLGRVIADTWMWRRSYRKRALHIDVDADDQT
ncbi:hypothetical protein JNN96_38050 [Mycobacterium sp. DSM 3803]|nr:hypothetical protein [Mycobacterium sp. DSM 3803]